MRKSGLFVLFVLAIAAGVVRLAVAAAESKASLGNGAVDLIRQGLAVWGGRRAGPEVFVDTKAVAGDGQRDVQCNLKRVGKHGYDASKATKTELSKEGCLAEQRKIPKLCVHENWERE